MRSLIVVLVGVLLLSSGLFAKDNVYIGVEYGIAGASENITKSNYNPDLGNHAGYSTYNTMKIGKYFGSHRISLDVDSGRKIGFNYDYIFDTSIYGLYPYVGTGYFYQTTQYTNSDASGRGAFIPFTIGLEYDLNKEFAIDFGFRITTDTYSYSSYYFDYDSGASTGVFLSILYNFKD